MPSMSTMFSLLLVRAAMGPFLFVILFALEIGVSHSASPAEVYWHAVLPNTPMPSVIHDLLADETAAGEGGLKFSTTYKGRPEAVHDEELAGPSPIIYTYKAPATEIKDCTVCSLFFLQKDLHPGANKTVHFIRTSSGTTLLPRRIADSIPFSSIKFPEILARLSVEPNSMEALSMKKILQKCEETPLDGVKKYCATSLESMVDFSTSTLGTRNLRALSTAADATNDTPKQVYTVSKVRRLAGSKLVVCHVMNYAYAVFYCHTDRIVAYTVSMVGNDGTKVEAVAACHTETARFNPKSLAFQVLNVKPGTVPVCHFLLENDILWSPNK